MFNSQYNLLILGEYSIVLIVEQHSESLDDKNQMLTRLTKAITIFSYTSNFIH